MSPNWIIVISIALSSQFVSSQIPTACSDPDSLQNLTCCPNNCGADESRGSCVDLGLRHNMESLDVRGNWPHYFTRACSCTGNYSGVDCSRCKYGHFGTNCEKYAVISRRPIHLLTGEEWTNYTNILKMSRTRDSGYKIVLDQYRPGTVDIETADIDLYDFFVWLHHFAAKDSECDGSDICIKVDYAHEATGFPTWHRQYLLWFEMEIQWMLQARGDPNYHTFRVPYWDWRRDNRSDEIFQRNRLGVSLPNQNGQSQVSGDLVSDGWDTICWFNGSGNVIIQKGTICNPNNKTGPLLRCPHNNDFCTDSNSNWPTKSDADNAISKPLYDTESYDRTATDESFRNFMEGFDGSVSTNECASNGLCICGEGGIDCTGQEPSSPLQRRLHNTVHIILGFGDFKNILPTNVSGVMSDVGSSPNDPIFINHHAMVDFILERWLQKHADTREYPDVPNEIKGHQRDGFIVPFFPLFKHSDVFEEANKLGYSYESGGVIPTPFYWAVVILLGLQLAF